MRHRPKQCERGSEMAHRLKVGRAFFGSTTGTLKVLERLLRVAAASEVIRELFDVIVEPLRIKGLERHTDANVESAPALSQDGIVRHAQGKRVLEGVLDVAGRRLLIDEL